MVDSRVVNGAEAQQALGRGMATVARLLRPTLGPLPRTVAIAQLIADRPPEVVDNAATISRRILQLPDPFEDMGGQLMRHLAFQVQERVGDGAAAATILASELMRLASPLVASGIAPGALVRGIERGAVVVRDQLLLQARAISQPAELAQVAAATLEQPALAAMVGEILDSIGPDGAVLVEESQAIETTYDYVDGIRWHEGFASPYFLADGETSVRLTEPRILLTDIPLTTAEQLLPAVEACIRAGSRRLLVVTPEIRDSALSLLLINRDKGVLDGVLAVRAPGAGTQISAILEDIAVVTGGRCLRQDRQDSLTGISDEDLGQARQAWATRFAFGILGGKGSKAAIRQQMSRAKAELRLANDTYARDKIRERIGKLAGQAAIVRVGTGRGAGQSDLKSAIEAAVVHVRLAQQHGVVSGGGAALVSCLASLNATRGTDAAEEAGIQLLARALSEPMRAIIENAGLEPGPIINEAQRRGPDWAYDVVRRDWVKSMEAGLTDPVAVPLAVLETSVSVAKMALTTGALVRSKRPEFTLTP